MLPPLVVCCFLFAVTDCAPVFRGSVDWKEGVKNRRFDGRPTNFDSLKLSFPSQTPPGSDDYPSLKFKNKTLDFEEAVMFARMSALSYCDTDSLKAWNCTMCKMPKIRDFVLWDALFSEDWDAAAYIGYFPQNNTKVIVFRGTHFESLWNWIENLKAYRSSLPLDLPGADGAYVHTGFFKMWNNSGLRRNLTIAMADMLSARGWDGPLVVAGHSLGGAMASLCSTYMKYMFRFEEVKEYTYGSPRVGNMPFVKAFERMITMNWRFTHQHDIVPSVPFVWYGLYHHVPVEIWQRDVKENDTAPEHTTYKVCNGEGEDPDCIAGACYLGWCRSVDDHLTYLHVPMHCV